MHSQKNRMFCIIVILISWHCRLYRVEQNILGCMCQSYMIDKKIVGPVNLLPSFGNKGNRKAKLLNKHPNGARLSYTHLS